MVAQTQQIDHFGKQRAGLLCYIVGMVVVLTIYRVLITVIVQMELFDTITDYQRHTQIMSTLLLFLMLGFFHCRYAIHKNPSIRNSRRVDMI